MSKSIVIGVDVGGTFTDILALDENTGEVRVAKVPSTRGDQSAGFLGGIKADRRSWRCLDDHPWHDSGDQCPA